MKKIRDFIADDMFNHIAMSGPAINKYFDPEGGMTVKEKEEYAKGIICTYPFMMLNNFCAWRYDEEDPIPKPYAPFMESQMPKVQEICHPLLERCYDEAHPISGKEKSNIFVEVLTEIVPRMVIGGFYAYMYGDEKLEEFMDELRPMLKGVLANVVLPAVFDEDHPMDDKTKTEIFRFIGLRLAVFCMKKMYDWMYGAEIMTLGPPPGEGGEGGPGPGPR